MGIEVQQFGFDLLFKTVQDRDRQDQNCHSDRQADRGNNANKRNITDFMAAEKMALGDEKWYAHRFRLSGAHLRKQNYVFDRNLVGKQHHDAVNADADATGRRHAVFHGRDKILVHRLGFLVT